MIMFRRKQEGFTLLEVLVAVLVFSFGLLGIAGMMTISVRNNHNGYLRSQANFLAENIVDRMRANPVALWRNGYNINPAVIGTTDCTLNAPCNYDTLATYDTQHWAQSLASSLPNGLGSIACVANDVVTTNSTSDLPSIWTPVSVFDGMCTVTITWNEANGQYEADTQTLSLVVQP